MSEPGEGPGGEDDLRGEGEGETVGEARWAALRELEQRFPGLDREQVDYQVVSEGRRGMLGVGYEPARVVASLGTRPERAPAPPPADEDTSAALAREVLERVLAALGIPARAQLEAGQEELLVTVTGSELGLLIGKHGQTIDAVQYLLNAIVHRRDPRAPAVLLDAEGYRQRRARALRDLALRAADQVRREGAAQELEPMTASERKVVHLCLEGFSGVRTESAGSEPNRYVVILPDDQV